MLNLLLFLTLAWKPPIAYTFVQNSIGDCWQERAIAGENTDREPPGKREGHFMSPSENRRFDCWKQIAAFLGRDVRTVWRWEKERGLPVHRVPGDGRRAVFAYQTEIEAWLKNAGHLSDGPNATENSEPESSPTSPQMKRPKSAVLWGGGAVLVLCTITLVFFSRGARIWAIGGHATRIERVSPIYAATDQGIIVEGKGFGPPPKTILMTRVGGGVDTVGESYSTSIRIDDLGQGAHHWIAGRAGPLNHCDIALKLASWTDQRIVLAGFAGPLGTSCKDQYQIAPGDKLRIIIWGPRNKCGPGGPSQCPEEVKAGRVATFETVVVPSKDVPISTCRPEQ